VASGLLDASPDSPEYELASLLVDVLPDEDELCEPAST
jgi:hypothetical protein